MKNTLCLFIGAALIFVGGVRAAPPAGVPIKPEETRPPAQVSPLQDPVISAPLEIPMDPALLERRRTETLLRWLPKIEVSSRPVDATNCIEKAIETSKEHFYQLFVKRERMINGKIQLDYGLVPLEYDYVLRTRVDEERLRPSCDLAKELIAVKLPMELRRNKEHVADYVLLLFMAEWAQMRADPKTTNSPDIPSNIVLDPFGAVTGVRPVLRKVGSSGAVEQPLPVN